MPKSGSIRIAQFDALRGLAACSVVIGHFFLALRGVSDRGYAAFYDWTLTLSQTPLRLFWSGHAAVVLFFTLSGFVLYLMLERTRLSFPAYAVKRTLRLYVPYLVAVALGIAGQHWLVDGNLADMGRWINKFWQDPIDLWALTEHLVFLGAFDSSRYDFTIWTLVHEMRISLLFPLIFLMIRRWPGWAVLGLFALASAAMAVVRITAYNGYDVLIPVARDGGYTAYAYTVHYSLSFVVGALLAANHYAIGIRYAGLPRSTRALLGILALTLYLYGSQAMQITGTQEMVVGDWPLMASTALVLVMVTHEPSLERLLTRASLLYLGRVSYSLYLLHPIVLLAALHIGHDQLPLGALLVIAFGACFLAADLTYRLVERPAIQLARAGGDCMERLWQPRARRIGHAPASACLQGSDVQPPDCNEIGYRSGSDVSQ